MAESGCVGRALEPGVALRLGRWVTGLGFGLQRSQLVDGIREEEKKNLVCTGGVVPQGCVFGGLLGVVVCTVHKEPPTDRQRSPPTHAPEEENG